MRVTYLVRSDAALARILGVSRAAVWKAAADGKIGRAPDGWDVLDTVQRWRENTWPLLQRPGRAREFRPWLDHEVPLRGSILAELKRRALAEGAERVDDGWDNAALDEEDLALEDEDDGGND